MSIITSPEMFINMKSIPKPNSREYEDFVKYELEKIKYGVTINGVKIPAWLYFHINHWKIYQPRWDDRLQETIDVYDRPLLRDNEWIIAESIERAKQEKKGLIIAGSRRISKTTVMASWTGHGATIYEGSQNVIVGNNKGDITNITTQLDKGLNSLEMFMRYPRIADDWRNMVALGWKDKAGNRTEWSKIYIKNTEDGINTEVLAGLTPKTLVYDEIAKASIKEAFLAGVKAFASPYGWRCTPLLFCTGGNVKRSSDAEEMFHNPDTYNLLAVEVPGESRKTGVFISGLYSVDVPKNPEPLSEFLNVEKGSELDNIIIHVKDEEKGMEIINEERERWAKAKNNTELLKAKMYAPLNVDECFLSDEAENPFPTEALKEHLLFLNKQSTEKYVRLYRDINGKVCAAESNLKPIVDFPVNKDTDKRAPIIIYEDPISNPPNYLYIGGSDPYNTDKSINSPSLGTVCIYKRTYDVLNGTFQNRVVASLASRPETMKEWFETVEMLLEYYNATLMIENAGTNFIQYMDSKNKSHWLADGYNLAKEIQPNTSIQGRLKGLPPTTKIQGHYKNLILEYCTEEVIMGVAQNGEVIKQMGLVRLNDKVLIEELINWKPNTPTKKYNADRYVAFGHALIYDEYLGKIAPNVKIKEEEEIKQPIKQQPRSPFLIQEKQINKKRNPFNI